MKEIELLAEKIKLVEEKKEELRKRRNASKWCDE